MNNQSVKIEREGDFCRVFLPEKFVVSIVPGLKEDLKNLIEEGVSAVEFDFSATQMLDSSGIGLLTAAANSMAKQNGTIKVVDVAPEIYRLLTMMRLCERLNVSSVQE
ncbi:MAG: STAS domain-containing protein [Desulfuromonadales bacterium]|nr:STAS domain-containing protein [Desulfuromonadales bacterium]MBN2791560.1 STAS domain-containing protein [Desulfuromonadales bacterium]